MKSREGERGAALIMAMVAVLFVGALGAALTLLTVRAGKAVRAGATQDELLNAAESGLEIALSRLAADPTWRGAQGVEVPGGTCDVSAKRLKTGTFEIASRALRGNRECTLRITAEVNETKLFRVSSWQFRIGRATSASG